jgi:surface protein
LGTWDTSNVTDMREMFAGTTRLTGLDLSNWDTSNVEDMTFMFAGANALRTIYASEKFVTTKVTDVVNSMFAFTDLVG